MARMIVLASNYDCLFERHAVSVSKIKSAFGTTIFAQWSQ
jgi:hypothetical protein